MNGWQIRSFDDARPRRLQLNVNSLTDCAKAWAAPLFGNYFRWVFVLGTRTPAKRLQILRGLLDRLARVDETLMNPRLSGLWTAQVHCWARRDIVASVLRLPALRLEGRK